MHPSAFLQYDVWSRWEVPLRNYMFQDATFNIVSSGETCKVHVQNHRQSEEDAIDMTD